MANPGPVASIFWLDSPLNSRLRLDGIICCVDARNIGYQLEWTSSSPVGSPHDDGDDRGGDEAARQIAFADRIILNKVDLLNKKQHHHQSTLNDYSSDNKCTDDNNNHNNNRDQSVTTTSIELVLRQIESINPTSPILTTTYSIVNDLNWILDTNCFNVEHVKNINMSFQHQQEELLYANPGDGWTKNLLHRHTNAVGTTTLFSIGSVSLHQITWLASILWPDQDEYDSVLRARLEGRDTSCDEEVDNDKEDDDDASRLTKKKQEMMITMKKDKDRQMIYRVKGVLSVRHDNNHHDDDDKGLVSNDGTDRQRYIIQSVHDLWDIQPASMDLCWNNDDAAETRCCKVIIIGKCLDVDWLRKGFMDCFMTQ
jgi:G3E family GTPase